MMRKNYNPRFSLTILVFHTKEAAWCARIIDDNEYQSDPRSSEALQSMEALITASKVCQFIHCCRRMSNCITDYNDIVRLLGKILEKTYAPAGKQ